MITVILLLCLVLPAIGVIRYADSVACRMFLTVLLVSTCYYGVLGPWYWLNFENGIFLGGNWQYYLTKLPLIYVSVFFLIMFIFIKKPLFKYKESNSDARDFNESQLSIVILYFFLIIGVLSSTYVYLVGSSIDHLSELTNDPFVLILYQFSDLLIPVILFALGCKKTNKKVWLAIVILFIAYSTFTGLRYKIALLVGPILLAFYFDSEANKKSKLTIMLSLTILGAFFSIMTVARNKFSGIDMESVEEMRGSSFLYGLFAETNSVFGLASAFKHYGERYDYVLFQPLIEVFVQFVPRFMYPEKDLYRHLKDIAYGISMSDESARSGTTLPFFGEYYVMFGWFGIIVGVYLFTVISMYLLKLMIRFSLNKKQLLIGLGLVTVYMAYYYYSRGSMAQIFKGIVFILIPYILLLRLQKYKSVKFN